MTSEFDIPLQLLGIAHKRTSDPIAQKAIDEVAGLLNALHYYSHDYARGTAPSPMSPRHDKRTDHWMRKIRSVDARLSAMNRVLDEILEFERKEKEEEAKRKDEENFCPTCHDRLPNHLDSCGSKEAWQPFAMYRIVECLGEFHGLCFCPDCSPEFWKNTKVEKIGDKKWRVPK